MVLAFREHKANRINNIGCFRPQRYRRFFIKLLKNMTLSLLLSHKFSNLPKHVAKGSESGKETSKVEQAWLPFLWTATPPGESYACSALCVSSAQDFPLALCPSYAMGAVLCGHPRLHWHAPHRGPLLLMPLLADGWGRLSPFAALFPLVGLVS